jgi:hypothetical protein
MGANTAELRQAIKVLQAKLDAELAQSRVGLRFGLERGKALFEEELVRLHKQTRTSLYRYVVDAHPLVVLTGPFIYALIIPLVLMDVCVCIYQTLCFPIYKIAKVRRADYLVFDRHHLPYLNALEKINCAYCSYANGIIAYAREIAARTEMYWCPIKHARRLITDHGHYAAFADFGDANALLKTKAPPAALLQNDTSDVLPRNI